MGLAFYFYDAWASDGDVDVDGLENPVPYTANRQAAFDASVTYAGATFGTFSDVAKRNLPAGVWIANWGPAETAVPELPDTGASTAQLWGVGALAAGLLAAGGALMVRARRSN
jgi:LPXTG-motif cell wall-anchored protein